MKLFKNAIVYTPNSVQTCSSILVGNGTIQTINPEEGMDFNSGQLEVIDLEGNHLIPGLIDIHVHGGGGYDVMSGLSADIDGMSMFHASQGTTSFLPTTITEDKQRTQVVLSAIAEAIERGTSGAEVLGIHLEGPFLNAARCGAQNPKHIREANIEELREYIEYSRSHIRLITMAPEQEGSLETIQYAVKEGIAVSIGHSDATYGEVLQAVEAGATHVTHLFNGMSPLHHREPGVAGAGMMLDKLAVELICDGYHVNPELVSYVFRVKPKHQIVLVTDCISAGGAAPGEHSLGSLPILVKNGQARLLNVDGSLGSLAGSCLTMVQALRNAIQYTGKTLAEIIPALSINPARQIGVDRWKGSLEEGKDADFVVLDQYLQVQSTYVKGRLVYNRIE